MDSRNAQDMELSLKESKSEIDQLNNQHKNLLNRLAALENTLYEMRMGNSSHLDKQQAEIDALKEQNDEMLNELEYWGRVTRAKLEHEIQTYRSILNCQVKLMKDSASEASVTLQNIKTKQTASTVTSEVKDVKKTTTSSEAEAKDILRQVFNYFDSDKSGTVNSKELDTILQRLNIRLSKEAYNQLCHEFDKDGMILY